MVTYLTLITNMFSISQYDLLQKCSIFDEIIDKIIRATFINMQVKIYLQHMRQIKLCLHVNIKYLYLDISSLKDY